jgi:hypothetical protein
VIPQDRLRTPDGLAAGLRGEYFEGRSFEDPEAVRVDARLDFEWPPSLRPISRRVVPRAVEVSLDLPAGRYAVEWLDPRTGALTPGEPFDHPGGRKSLTNGAFDEDLALAVRAR